RKNNETRSTGGNPEEGSNYAFRHRRLLLTPRFQRCLRPRLGRLKCRRWPSRCRIAHPRPASALCPRAGPPGTCVTCEFKNAASPASACFFASLAVGLRLIVPNSEPALAQSKALEH